MSAPAAVRPPGGKRRPCPPHPAWPRATGSTAWAQRASAAATCVTPRLGDDGRERPAPRGRWPWPLRRVLACLAPRGRVVHGRARRAAEILAPRIPGPQGRRLRPAAAPPGASSRGLVLLHAVRERPSDLTAGRPCRRRSARGAGGSAERPRGPAGDVPPPSHPLPRILLVREGRKVRKREEGRRQ
ncbi:hypothetical protein SETIT_9G151500v2 [Setaria italica]|uniref:Uncharacterized protein n=1 Tax=Setaria italica TaxID=4555 RepID=A0A368SGQ2_SETIT|nr:hypothetical protein SETIT_9G151500v2 [Setaria italica]